MKYNQIDLQEIIKNANITYFMLQTFFRNKNVSTKTMAMWGNHIQRIKIVINDNIIEQVTDFKYLGYCIYQNLKVI